MTKVRWMSRDSQGDYVDEVYFWPEKPKGDAGIFTSDQNLDNFSVGCVEFSRFCKIFHLKAPNSGELIKLTVKSESIQILSTRDDIVKRLRASKKFDKELLVEAAAWVSDK